MKELFYRVDALDAHARNRYRLSEELMTEHAALAVKKEIEARFPSGSSILIVTGCGNNGADGYALARLLYGYDVSIFVADEPKSELCKLQRDKASLCGIPLIISEYKTYSIVVDAIFGSGLRKPLDKNTQNLINQINAMQAYKIACDMPSGLFENGQGETVFLADLTVTMGAAKIGLFSDFAKDYVGEVVVTDLGVSSKRYLSDSNCDGFLLEETDLVLPIRTRKSSHKGDYGHLAVFAGEKEGACILCGSAALSFGAGLVTLISYSDITIPAELMQDAVLPDNTATVCLGSGLGDILSENEITKLTNRNISFVLDADMFYKKCILGFLAKKSVLTPHPKEFASLLSLCGLGHHTVANIQSNRFRLAKEFSLKYPNSVLVLKGANTIIAQNGELFICSSGSVALAKGGSGDVLAGLIGALLAQGYKPLEAAKNGVLAHALASQKFKNNYALTPSSLIERIKEL